MAQDITLQNAAVGNGNGSPFIIGGAQIGMVEANITGITTATVNWEGTGDNTHWFALQAFNVTTGAWATTATVDGIYLIPTQGMEQVRARISGWSAGTITIQGKAASGTAAELVGGAVADGANAALGATTDAAVTTNAVGTVSAKLRGMVAILADVWDNANHWLKVQLQAGEAHLGSVGGQLINAVDTLGARPANTTAYASGQQLNIAPLLVTAATNANPSVVTINGHGLTNGLAVNITGSVGNTAINGTFLVAGVTTNTFTLTDINGVVIAGNGVWSSGGSLIRLLTLQVARIASGSGYLVKMKLELDGIAMVGNFRIYLYSGFVTPSTDASTWNILKANNAIRVGYIDLTAITEGAGSDCSIAVWSGPPFKFTADVNKNLYAVVVDKSSNTPISGGTVRLDAASDAY